MNWIIKKYEVISNIVEDNDLQMIKYEPISQNR